MAETAAPRSRIRLLLVAIGVGLFGLLGGGALTLVALLGLQAAGVGVGPLLIIVVSLLLTQGVGMGGAALLYLRYRDLSLDFVGVGFPSLRGWIWTGAGYVFALVGMVAALMLLVLAFGEPETTNQAVELAFEEPRILLVMIPGAFLLIGPGEELLFRGIVQGTLREAFDPAIAITIASAVFAGIHVLALTGGLTARLMGVAALFVPSLVLGIAYERTGNIVVPSLIHGAYNATLFTLLYVTLVFGSSPP